MEAYGRRWTFLLLGLIGMIGPCIQVASIASDNYTVLIVGKVILGVSMGMASTSVGAYLAECAPARTRGLLVNFYSVVLNSGYVVSIGVAYSVIYRQTRIQYLLPMSLQVAAPTIIAVAALLLPESPR